MVNEPLPTNPDVPLLPVVHDNLQQLAAMPPGVAAQSKIADILELIKAMLTNPAISSLLPSSWLVYIAAAVAGISLLLGGGLLGRWTAPTAPVETPTTPLVVNVPPASVVVVPPPTPAVTPPVVTPAAKMPTLILYSVEGGLDITAIAADASVVKLGIPVWVSTLYVPASTYLFNGKSIPLPCMAWVDEGGKLLDVQTFANAGDVVAFVGKHRGKQ